MASIRKLASGRYQVQIRRAGMPSVTRSFTKKKDADAFVREVEGNTELARKLGKATAHIPLFGNWVTIFLAAYRGRDKDITGKLGWWSDRFGNLPVNQIDEFLVDDSLIELSKYGRNGKKPCSGSTINRYKSALSSCLVAFIRHPDYKRAGFANPVRKESVSRFKENPPKDRFLSETEQSQLLAASGEAGWNKLYLLVLMALTTGARRGELTNLKWSDIDFARRTAQLSNTKNGKPRVLPLTKPVVEELIRFRENSDHLIFSSTVSSSKPFDFKKHWLNALNVAGIGSLRFHDLRHTAASNLVRAGRTLFEVSTLLGHSSTTMTARYSHLAIHDTRSMVDSVMGELQ